MQCNAIKRRRFRENHVTRTLYSILNIIRIIKLKGMKCVVNVAVVGDIRHSYKSLVRNILIKEILCET
jgi:hypothetical protein